MKKQYIFLSHDVDWGYNGPSRNHILERKDRFDDDLFANTPINDLYRNFSEFMEIEEKYDVKSTFFFRTQYEDGDYKDYHDNIKELFDGGWEIGLHTDPTSVKDIKKIKTEKENLEKLINTKILGNRVHYLSNDEQLLKKLAELDFVYDSSIKNSKDGYKEDIGYYLQNEIFVGLRFGNSKFDKQLNSFKIQ